MAGIKTLWDYPPCLVVTLCRAASCQSAIHLAREPDQNGRSGDFQESRFLFEVAFHYEYGTLRSHRRFFPSAGILKGL